MRHGLMHLDHVVTRNVMRVGSVRDPVAFRRYVEVLALSTAGLPSSTTLFQAAHINQRTADAYDWVLQNLYLLDLMPPWASNHFSRLLKRSKRYIVDAGAGCKRCSFRCENHSVEWRSSWKNIGYVCHDTDASRGRIYASPSTAFIMFAMTTESWK